MADQKLSLSSAIMININTMIGAGMFINTVTLAAYAGGLCPLSYVLVGLMTIPLVIAFAVLLDVHGEGSFFTIIRDELGALMGFVGTWIFFISRSAVLGLLVHFNMAILQELFVGLKQYPIMALDFIFLAFLVCINLLNMRVGSGLQILFTAVKIAAAAVIIALGIWYFNTANFVLSQLKFSGLALTIPIALFAYLGFDVTVSLSKHIENPKRNGPRAMLYSYIIVVAVYCIYQLCYYAALDLSLFAASNGTISSVIPLFIQSTVKSPVVISILNVCVWLSAFSATYGIMFGNIWNLHALTENKLFVGSELLATKNSAGVASRCLFIEALICAATLFFGGSATLELIGVLGSSIVYAFSMWAFLRVARRKTRVAWHSVIAILSLAVCGVYLVTGVQGLMKEGGSALLYLVLGITLFGVVLYVIRQRKPASA